MKKIFALSQKTSDEVNETKTNANTSSPQPVNLGNGDPINEDFNSLGFSNAKRLREELETPTSNRCTSIEVEMYAFLGNVDEEDINLYFFFKTKQSKLPELSRVAKMILYLLPLPAKAERCFSKASLFTENRRNRLSVSSTRDRLIAC